MSRFFKIVLIAFCLGMFKPFGTEVDCNRVEECLIVTSNNFNSMKGTQGQNTFCNYKGKIVMKNKVNGIANPCSTKQQTIRDAVQTLINYWLNNVSMTEEIKSLWDFIGSIQPTNKNPETGVRAVIRRSTSVMTGLDAFIGYNIRALTVGGAVPAVTVPPVHSPAAPLNTIAPSWTVSGTLVVTWVKDPATTVTDIARLWAVSRTAGIVHKQILKTVAASAETVSVTEFIGKNGTPTLLANIIGADLYLQMDVVKSDNGNASAPSNTVVTRVA